MAWPKNNLLEEGRVTGEDGKQKATKGVPAKGGVEISIMLPVGVASRWVSEPLPVVLHRTTV